MAIKAGDKVTFKDPGTKAITKGTVKSVSGGSATVNTEEGAVIVLPVDDLAADTAG